MPCSSPTAGSRPGAEAWDRRGRCPRCFLTPPSALLMDLGRALAPPAASSEPLGAPSQCPRALGSALAAASSKLCAGGTMYLTFRCNEVMGVTDAWSGPSPPGSPPTPASLVAGPGLQEVGACSAAVGGLNGSAAEWGGQGFCAGVGADCTRVGGACMGMLGGGACIDILIPTCSAVGGCSWEWARGLACSPLSPLTTSDLQVGSGLQEPARSDCSTLWDCDCSRCELPPCPKEPSELDTGGRGWCAALWKGLQGSGSAPVGTATV